MNQTAKLFGISVSSIKEWKKRKNTGASLEPKIRQRKPFKIPPDELQAFVDANPDAYLTEIAKHFNCSGEGVRKALKRMKITRKKRQ